MHERKTTISESIGRTNEGFEQTIGSLKKLGQLKLIPKESLRSIVIQIEEMRAGFAGGTSERERIENTRLGKERRASEKRLEDPDNAYFVVQQLEQHRRK